MFWQNIRVMYYRKFYYCISSAHRETDLMQDTHMCSNLQDQNFQWSSRVWHGRVQVCLHTGGPKDLLKHPEAKVPSHANLLLGGQRDGAWILKGLSLKPDHWSAGKDYSFSWKKEANLSSLFPFRTILAIILPRESLVYPELCLSNFLGHFCQRMF